MRPITNTKIVKSLIISILIAFSTDVFSQAACTSANYGGATVIPANAYPYTSAGTGITVTATTAGGVATLNNFSYNCSGTAYNCTNPAWWLNNAAQSITLTFSAPVSSFSVIVNGTNTCEEFYFAQVGGCPGQLSVSGLCTAGWTSINGGTGLLYNGTTTSNLIVVNNTVGATTYLLTHNGCGAGSRYALVDCWVPGPPPTSSTLTSTMAHVDENCGQCDGTATVTPTSGTAPYNYTWNTVPVQNTQTATGLCAGTYIVNFTDASGCNAGIDTVVISSSAAGPAPVITPAGPFCLSDAPVNLAVSVVGGTWSGTGITNAANGTFSPATAGVGTHQIYFDDGTACPQQDTISITVIQDADATINAAGPFCESDAALNLTSLQPGGVWSGTGITNTTNGTFDPNTAGPGTHTITYGIAGQCGDTQTVNITILPDADATITAVGPFCESDAPLNLTAVDPGGTWSGTGITNAANGTFNPATAGVGTHTITYTIGGQCGDIQTTTITILPDMDATITPVGPFCESDAALNLAAVDPGGTWSGTGITNTANGTFDPNTAGVGTHTITYGIAGQCGDTQSVNITILPDADATITPAGPFCPLDPSVNLVGATAGGTWSGTGITNTTLGTFNPFTAGPGTHTITYGIAGQCGDTQTVNIVVSNSLDATINPVGPFCESEASLNLTAVDVGGTWSGTGITNTTNGTFDPNTAGPGTHLITYGIPGGCGDTQTVNITILPDLDATITPVGPFCESDASLNLAAVDPGGTWNGTGITNTANGTFDPNTAGPGTHTITYGIAGQCGDTQTVNITILPDLDATITQVGPFCESDAALNLTAVDPGGTWNGTGITNTANGTFDPNTAGVGTHTITYGIAGQCGDTQTVNITILPDADATITPVGPFCPLDPSINLVGATAGGTWSGTGITNTTTGTFNPFTAGPGTHTITYGIAGQCGDTQTVNITVTNSLNATITPAGPFCESDASLNLTAVDPNGVWSGTGITNATNGTFDPNTAGPGTHTITYGITGGCGDTQTVNITILPDLNATINMAGPFCLSDLPYTLTAVDPGGTWSGTGITNAANGTFDPNMAGVGTHTITYGIAGQCGDTQTVNITVNVDANAAINAAGPFCENDPVATLTSIEPGGSWSGPGITNATNGTFDPSLAGAGTHTITYGIAGACGDTQTVNITVIPNADATITPVGTLCITDPAFQLVGVTPNGTWSGTGITNAGTGLFDPSVAGAGTHTITYTVAGACGDVKTTTITVTPLDDPTITQAGPFCVSATPLVLTAATPGGTWSGNGITSPTVGSFDPNSAGPGTHTITYVTGGNCSDTDTMNIVVNGLPNVSFDADTLNVCLVPVTPFEFTNTTDTTGGMVGTSLWNFGDGNTGSGTTVLHSYTSPGSYSVTLTVTSTAGAGSCTNSLTKNSYVNVYQNPTADFLTTPNPTTVFDPTINFIDQSYVNIVSWLWNFGGLGTSIIQHPTYTFPDDTGTYAVTLLVTDANGCQNSVTESAIVKGEHAIYIPNSFTPFSDGLNDTFIPQGFGISDAGFEFYIFDRWGENIFSSHSLVDGWDGTYKGKAVQNGTYVWRVIYYDLNGKVYKQTGHVNVLK